MPVVTPTLTLCDNLVAALLTAWAPTAPSTAERHYFKRITDEDEAQDLADSIKLEEDERRVIVMPVDYDSRYGSKGEDIFTHEIQTLVVERYAPAGDPTRAWIDDRVDFTYTYIAQGFDFRSPPTWNRKLRTLATDVMVVDLAKLIGAGKLFFSLVTHTFEEFRDA
jgi:hypothetical protein